MPNPVNEQSAKSEAIVAIISNVKRLINDAQILQDCGSAGSALALAILAFEEAGKGHIVEHSWEKPKNVHSHHSYRHRVAFAVLIASLNQKYGIELGGLLTEMRGRFEEHALKPGARTPLPPMSKELRERLRAILLPQFATLSMEELATLGVEQRWLEKIALALQDDKLEKIRQSGLYLDTNRDFEVTSSPMATEKIESERWIWAATRVLNLLERGDFRQAYSPPSEALEEVLGATTA